MSKEYKIAIYLRLSLEDSDYKSKVESDSIANQRLLIEEYLSSQADLKNAPTITKVDDGYSGTSFDRPAVKELLDMVAKREINCIIVKDLSRFGRNYIEVGNYLEQIFPFLGVRFIAVNDDYDSKDPNCVGNLVSVFKTMFHDIYSKDLSEKVKSAKITKAMRGEYINAFPPYGYVKSKEDFHRLVIDEEAASVVRFIFHSFVGGKRKVDIARTLNAQAVLTPMLYQEKHHGLDLWLVHHSVGSINLWTDAMVGRALKDLRYKGSVVYRKRSVIAVASPLQRMNPKELWIIVDDTHEPIVSKELFDTAQSLIKEPNIFSNACKRAAIHRKVKCGWCGHVLISGTGKGSNYTCNNRRFTDKFSCDKATISIAALQEVVLLSIQKQAQQAADIEQILLAKRQNMKTAMIEKAEEIQRCETGIESFTQQHRSLFEAMVNGEVTKEYRVQESLVLTQQREELENHLKRLTTEKSVMQSENDIKDPFICGFKEYQHIESLTNEIVERLIDSIHVYDSNSIEIVFKFREEQERLFKLLEAT